jgi:hypothetical protein
VLFSLRTLISCWPTRSTRSGNRCASSVPACSIPDGLDDLPETAGADFLKLDVQGAELLVLEGAVARLADILVVHVEVEFLPLYKNQPLFADIDAFLRAQGFAFHTMKPYGRTFKPAILNNDIYAQLNQLIWADAVYVRDFMRFDATPPRRLAQARRHRPRELSLDRSRRPCARRL